MPSSSTCDADVVTAPATFRLAVLGDVHGNLPAFEATLADAATLAPDLVAHAGDMVNGPCSAAVMDRVLADGLPGVYGNHEDYVLRCADPDAPSLWRTDRFDPARWTRGTLSPRHLGEIGRWPISRRIDVGTAGNVALVHGTTADLRGYFGPRTTDDEARAMYADIAAPVIVCGHTHVPHIRRMDGMLIVNVGATGVPADGDPRAAYALVESREGAWHAKIRRVAYDTRAILDAARRSGWLEHGGGIAATMLHDMLTGGGWMTPFVHWWEETCPEARSADAYRCYARLRGIAPLI